MIHSFEPVIDKHCKILILGTMPGVQSLARQQYYGNKQNAFWKIIYALFNETPDDEYELKKAFLLEHHIALWDVLEACEREGSADAEITNPLPNDFESLFGRYKNIERVYFNGKYAEKLFNRYVKKDADAFHVEFHTLPSTSPANAIRFEDKLAQWKLILQG